MSLAKLKKELRSLANPEKAKVYQRFFKTGKGHYGEGDIFLGITVPEQRKIAKKFYKNLTLQDIQKLLSSKIHEERFTALEALNFMYEKNVSERKNIFDFYLDNTSRINNWDLVDTSAPYILGEYLFNRNKSILLKLSKSQNLWEKRISIIATFYFIKHSRFEETLKIAEILMNDKHDLIHKAVGWMLREVGNKNLFVEENFLKKHYKKMPRTMLRYAIEKFDDEKRKMYLRGKISV